MANKEKYRVKIVDCYLEIYNYNENAHYYFDKVIKVSQTEVVLSNGVTTGTFPRECIINDPSDWKTFFITYNQEIMSKSTFMDERPQVITLLRYLTDCVTGAVTEICVVKNLDDGTVEYFDTEGNALKEPPAIEAGVLEIGSSPVSVPLGNATFNDLVDAQDLAGMGVTCPPNAGFAIIDTTGPVIYTLDGTAPDGVSDPPVGIRATNRICIQGKKALENLQIAPLDGAGPVDVNFEFKNLYDDLN